jgi:hypothetical protein
MKSVMAVEDRKERRRGLRLRLFTLGAGLYVCMLLLAGWPCDSQVRPRLRSSQAPPRAVSTVR